MNDEFMTNKPENESAPSQEPCAPEFPNPQEAEPVANENNYVPPQPEPVAVPEPPLVQPEPVFERPMYTPPVQPQYTQPVNTPPYQQAQYSSYNQYNPPVPAPQPEPQKPNKNSGLLVFAACVSVLLIAAIAFIVVRFINPANNIAQPGVSTTMPTQRHDESGAPDITTNNTPSSSTEIPSEGPLTATQVAAKIKEYNVGIVVYARNSTTTAGEGTGVIMGESDDGVYTYIVTCAHVISDSGVSVSVQTHNGQTYDATIVGYDSRTDLGVIKIKASGLTAAEFGDSTALNVGDTVYAIGNPGGVEFFGSFTDGIVSAIDRPVSSEIGYTMNCIQHNAAINPGNSGGALVNIYGQVIGINSQKIAATDYEGMGFAIPISDALDIINNLIDYGYVPNRPKLGITYYPLTASTQYTMIAQINGLPAGTLIIDSIDSESSLANTDARQYDMIVAVNGQEMASADILLELIDGGTVGQELTLTLARVNQDYSVTKFDVKITLVEDKSTPETSTEQNDGGYYIDPFSYN